MIFKYFFYFIFLFSSVKAFEKKEVLVDGEKGLSRFVEFIEQSSESVQPIMLGAFKLQKGSLPRPEILQALKHLIDQKKVVHVFLESRLSKEERRDSQEISSNQSLDAFKNIGVILNQDVLPYKNVHLKFLLSDHFALIGTTNYDDDFSKYVKRDFSILTQDTHVIKELRDTLEKVKNRQPIEWPIYHIEDIEKDETRLSWGPGQHREHLLKLIDQAKKSLVIYQQDLQDSSINEALIKKIKQKVQVFILMSRYPFGRQNENKNLPLLENLRKEGANVCLVGEKKVYNDLPLHIHAKVLLSDAGTSNEIMYLGSANFYTSVLNTQGSNLNLGVITRDNAYIKIVHETFMKDWKVHHNIDQ
ncbi:MAG: phospholipase D-like domain-containing protein [Janthinobacterium lividum]